jgi:glycerol-3-phosphate acyltransferase PlsY
MRGKYVATGETAMSSSAWLPVAFIFGYLFGSIPFGLILTNLAGTQDLRSIGSGNIGATNVLRTGHKGLAAATLLLDMLKGAAAVMIVRYYGVLIGLFWPAAVVFCVLWLATAATTRYSSLSALVASFVIPIFLWWFGHPALASLFAVLTLLLFYMHRENIKRLQAGNEGRIGEK